MSASWSRNVPEVRGSALVLAAAILWGTTGTALAFAPSGTSPVTLGAVRITIGGAALVVIATLRGDLRPTGQS